MKLNFTNRFLLGFLTLFATSLFGQQTLEESLPELQRQHEANQQAVLEFLNQNPVPRREEAEDGSIFELVEIENGRPIYYTTFNRTGGVLIRASRVYPNGGAGLNLTGTGQLLGIWDGGRVRTSHQEFISGGSSRVTVRDGSTSTSSHATHVAGTMAGGGIAANARGMSYAAMLHSYDWSNDLAEMTNAALNDNLQVSQHSYGSITGWTRGNYSGVTTWHWFGNPAISETEDYNFGFYGNRARSWDNLAFQAPEYLIVKSAGNDRGEGPTPGSTHRVFVNGAWTASNAVRPVDGGMNGYDCITDAGNAKNVMTVGAVNTNGAMSSFSGWGPTDDGRIKPDIVAKGVTVYSATSGSNTSYGNSSGTSMSGPMVSGAVGLLLQHQQNLEPGKRLLAPTLKALILHTANDMIGGSPGPDYRNGWGLMDVEKATQVMSANNATKGLHIHELTLENEEEIYIPIRAAGGGQPLRVTIVWNDLPGIPPPISLNPSTPMLVNDLDMRLLNEDGATVHEPWILNPAVPQLAATTGDNFRDNVEMIHVANPVPGSNYVIRISHKSLLAGGRQNFSLIVSGNLENEIKIPAALVPENAHLYIAGQNELHEVLTVEKLTVTREHQLTIKPGSGLEVKGAVLNNGQIILESNQTNYARARFLGTVSGTGQLTQEMWVGSEGFHLIGAPVTGGQVNQFGQVNPAISNLMKWDASNGNWVTLQGPETLISGEGYRALAGPNGIIPAAHKIATTGTLVLQYAPAMGFSEAASGTTDFSDPVARSGWNLVANPFPAPLMFSKIDAALFNGIEQAHYIWNPNKGIAGNYEAYAAAKSARGLTGDIAPMQGFWIRTTGLNADWGPLNPEMTSLIAAPKFLKNETFDGQMDILVLEQGDTADFLTLTFSKQGNDGFDDGLDARKLLSGNASPNLFSVAGGEYTAINALNYPPNASFSKIIPLGFVAEQVGRPFQIGLDAIALGNEYDVVLEDQYLDVFHHLQQDGPYSFENIPTEPLRFRLHLNTKRSLVEDVQAPIAGWLFGNDLRLRSEGYSGQITWSLYDAAGKHIARSEPNQIEIGQTLIFTIPNVAHGVYFIQVDTKDGPAFIKLLK
jgi:hypothetical protein